MTVKSISDIKPIETIKLKPVNQDLENRRQVIDLSKTESPKHVTPKRQLKKKFPKVIRNPLPVTELKIESSKIPSLKNTERK